MMETKEYRTVDKSTWGDGPWQNEPDKMQWQDFATGLPCLIVRSPVTGSLCGYVGVSSGHPLFEVDYGGCSQATECLDEKGGVNHWCDHRPELLLDVHGGITFSGACQKTSDESAGVCHLPAPGESDNVFWFGFDTAHAFDLTPAMNARLAQIYREKGEPLPDCYDRTTEHYRDLAYVKDECEKLALQLKEMQA